jgi:hypothetical protein
MVLDNLENALFKVRSGKDKGEWIDEDRLKELRDEWKDEKWQNISKINTQNRKSKAGHNVHSGGSISAREHAKKMVSKSCIFIPNYFVIFVSGRGFTSLTFIIKFLNICKVQVVGARLPFGFYISL